jgi:hypothetical protein
MTFQKQDILKKYHLSDNEMSVPEAEGKIENSETEMSKIKNISECGKVSDQMSESELSNKSLFPLKDNSEKGQVDNKQLMTFSESELYNKMSDDKVSHAKMSLDQKSGMFHPDNFNKDNSKPDRQPEFEMSNRDNSKADDSTKLKVIPQIGHIISPSGEEEEATFDNDDTSTNRPFNSKSTQQKLQKNSATINDISNEEEFTKFGKRKSVAKMQHSS